MLGIFLGFRDIVVVLKENSFCLCRGCEFILYLQFRVDSNGSVWFIFFIFVYFRIFVQKNSVIYSGQVFYF